MPVRTQALPAKVPFSDPPLPGFVSIKAIWSYYNQGAFQNQLIIHPVTYVSQPILYSQLNQTERRIAQQVSPRLLQSSGLEAELSYRHSSIL